MNKFILKRTAMKLWYDIADTVTFLFMALRMMAVVCGLLVILFSFAVSIGDWITGQYSELTMISHWISLVSLVVLLVLWVRNRYMSSVREIQ